MPLTVDRGRDVRHRGRAGVRRKWPGAARPRVSTGTRPGRAARRSRDLAFRSYLVPLPRPPPRRTPPATSIAATATSAPTKTRDEDADEDGGAGSDIDAGCRRRVRRRRPQRPGRHFLRRRASRIRKSVRPLRPSAAKARSQRLHQRAAHRAHRPGRRRRHRPRAWAWCWRRRRQQRTTTRTHRRPRWTSKRVTAAACAGEPLSWPPSASQRWWEPGHTACADGGCADDPERRAGVRDRVVLHRRDGGCVAARTCRWHSRSVAGDGPRLPRSADDAAARNRLIDQRAAAGGRAVDVGAEGSRRVRLVELDNDLRCVAHPRGHGSPPGAELASKTMAVPGNMPFPDTKWVHMDLTSHLDAAGPEVCHRDVGHGYGLLMAGHVRAGGDARLSDGGR